MDMKPAGLGLADPGLAAQAASPDLASSQGRLGEILLRQGHLDAAGLARIALAQQTDPRRFGETAVALRLASPQDIEQALAQQFAYPSLAAEASTAYPALLAATQPFGPFAEQLRSLRIRMLSRLLAAPSLPHCVAMVSPGRGEGRSLLVANLAVTLAQMGLRTLLIDADLRQPAQHLLFSLDNRLGLSNILLGRATLDCACAMTQLGRLSVLGAGSRPPNPQELLARTALPALLDEAQGRFDIVLLDTPAAGLSADAQIVAHRAGNAVALVHTGHTPARALQRLAAVLRDSGTALLGTVLNAH